MERQRLERTQWFDGDVMPHHTGYYERLLRTTAVVIKWWDGKMGCWRIQRGGQISMYQFEPEVKWRGVVGRSR